MYTQVTVNGSASYIHILITFFVYEKIMLKEEALNLEVFVYGREEQSYGSGRNDKITFAVFFKLKVIE